MPKFAANLTMLFNEVPFMDRFERAAQAGFEAVEFLFPYDYAAADIKARLDPHRLALVLHKLPAGDWAAGERGIACLPGREDEFRAGVGQAIEYAGVLGVSQLNFRTRFRMAHRRKFIAVLGAGALATPLALFAQQPGRIWRVGILPGGPMAPRQLQWDAFRCRMRELGYVEGSNVQYEVRAPQKEGAPYDDVAAQLVQAKVDVIVATADTAMTAARQATQRIPIIMCPSEDPISEGFVTSLRQPDGNLTGISIQAEEATGKRLRQLRDLLPKAKRVAFIWITSSGSNWKRPRPRRARLACNCRAWKSTHWKPCRLLSKRPQRRAPMP